MSDRLDALRLNVDAILTAMAQGYTPKGFIGSELLPVLAAPSDSVKYPVFGKQSFMIPDTRRGLRAEPVEVDFSASSATAALEEHSAQGLIDYREAEAGAQVGIDYTRNALVTAKRAIALGREMEISTLVTTAGNYDASHVIAVAATWDSTGDPVSDITMLFETIEDDIGVMPNVLTMSSKAWRACQNNSNVKAWATETIGPVKKISKDIFAMLVGVEKILVTNGKYSADGTTFSEVWDKSVVHAAYTATATGGDLDTSEPSFGFLLQRQFGSMSKDGDLPIYTISGIDTSSQFVSKVWALETYKPVITLADAGGILTGVL